MRVGEGTGVGCRGRLLARRNAGLPTSTMDHPPPKPVPRAAGRQVPPSRGPRRGARWGNGRCDGARWGVRRVRGSAAKRGRARQSRRLKIPRGASLVRVRLPPPAPFDAAPTPSRASLMARQPSWAEANVLSERSESKGSKQVDLFQTLTATAAPNSPVRGDARGATVGQFAEKPTAWPGWPDRAEADRWCGPGRARGKVASGVSWLWVGEVGE